MMPSESAALDSRIAALEDVLATGSDVAAERSARAELASCLAARYVRFEGADDDRVRAQRLASAVLADEDTTGQQRQVMSILVATLATVAETPAVVLRGHGGTLDLDALERTRSWQEDTDPETVLAGLSGVTEQLGAIDPEELPLEIRWAFDALRAATDLLADVQRPGWDGTVAPAVSAQLRRAEAGVPPGAPGLGLIRGLVAWVDPAADPAGELRDAIASLPGDDLLAPVLRGDLARALLRGSGPDALREATDLLEQAVAGMAPGHPLREEAEQTLVGALVAVAAGDPTPERLADLERLAADLVARPGVADDPARRGADLFLASLVGLLRSLTGEDRDTTTAVRDLVDAIALLPAGHALRPVAVGQLGAVLADRHLVGGLLENADDAVDLIDHAVRAVRTGSGHAEADADAAFIGCVAAVARVNRAVRLDRADELAAATEDLRTGLARLPAGRLLRSNLDVVLRVAELRAAAGAGGDVGPALAALRHAATEGPPVGVPAAVIASMVGALDVLAGLVEAEPGAVAAAIARMEADLATPSAPPHQRAAQLALLGKAYLAAMAAGTEVEDGPDRAVAHLAEARDLIGGRADALEGTVLGDLAVALRIRGDRNASRRVGREALEAYAATVLLQTGVVHALRTSRGAAAEATRLMRWSLADGDLHGAVQAVELGRGLTLHATTSTSEVPELLERVGREDLADAWRRDTLVRERGRAAGPEPDYARVADDLRTRVLDVLRATPEGRRLFAPPSPRALGRGLAAVGRDVLAYLVPGDAAVAGHLLLVSPEGRVTPVETPLLRLEPGGPVATYLATPRWDGFGRVTSWRSALERLCAWAGEAATVPLMTALEDTDGPPRVVLVPGGPLGVVPWQATAVSGAVGDVRYACEDAVFSTAASGRQLLDVASREALPLDGAPVLIGDPTANLPGARAEVTALARSFYPAARVLGAEATPGAVLSLFTAEPDGGRSELSLLHLGCHAETGGTPGEARLELTAPLQITSLVELGTGRSSSRTGPTVVAAACRSDATAEEHDEALTLATAFLAAGAVTVVGARWEVLDQLTAVAMFALHHFLAVRREPPADALRSAQLWMLDRRRERLPGMPAEIAGPARRRALADITVWAAFGHHGR